MPSRSTHSMPCVLSNAGPEDPALQRLADCRLAPGPCHSPMTRMPAVAHKHTVRVPPALMPMTLPSTPPTAYPNDRTMRSDAFADARAVIEHGLADRIFPAAIVNVGSRAGVRWQQAFGRLTYADDAPACTAETLFDLASLTKVIATTPIAMAHVRAGRVSLDAPVAASPALAAWRADERRDVTVRQLLDHSSGLPAHLRAWETASGRDAYLRLIRDTPLDRPPASVPRGRRNLLRYLTITAALRESIH